MANHTAAPTLPADLTAVLQTWNNTYDSREESEERADAVARLRSFLADVGSTALPADLLVRFNCYEHPRRFKATYDVGTSPEITGFRVYLVGYRLDHEESAFYGSCTATFFLDGRLSSLEDEHPASDGALDDDLRPFPYEDSDVGIVVSTDPDPQKQQVLLNGDLVTHRWLQEQPDPTYTALCPSSERGGVRFASDTYLRLPALDPPDETGLLAFVLNRGAWGMNLHVALLDVPTCVMYHGASINYDSPEVRAVRIRPDSDGTEVELQYRVNDYDSVRTTVYLAPEPLHRVYNGWTAWPAKARIQALAGWVGYSKANPSMTVPVTHHLQALQKAMTEAIASKDWERGTEVARAFLKVPYAGHANRQLLAAVVYNLACAESRLGHSDIAIATLEELEQQALYRSLYTSWESSRAISATAYPKRGDRNPTTGAGTFSADPRSESKGEWEHVVALGSTYLADPDAKQPLKIAGERSPWLTVIEAVAAAQVEHGNFDRAVDVLSRLETEDGDPDWGLLARNPRMRPLLESSSAFQDLVARHDFGASDRGLLKHYTALSAAVAEKRCEDAIAAGRAYLAMPGFDRFAAEAKRYALPQDTLLTVMSTIARCEASLGHADAAMTALLEIKKASEARTVAGIWDLFLLREKEFDMLREREDFKLLMAKDDHWGAPGAKMPTLMWNGQKVFP
ncbi:hypothetical protein HKX48_006887 [Thoreauomyces humboldtii]|nr:hypothetical protein HKX48_006887 [Thoreauomyces humboldtii]